MKKVKIKNKLILLIGIILLSGISLYGCGKNDGDEIVGKEFKVIHKNKIEAIMKFGVNHELTVISAQGKYNAGQEFRGQYQLKENEGKLLLLIPKIDREILDIQNFGYQTVEIHRKDSKDWYVYQLEEKDNKFFMYDLTIKDGKEDKFKGVNDLSMLEIKKEDDKNDINSILETNDNSN